MKMRIALLSLLTIVCLLLAVGSAMASDLYNNGPYDGKSGFSLIDFSFAVTDSFNVPTGSSIQGLQFVYWDSDATARDVLTTVDMSIGTTPGGTNISPLRTLNGVTNILYFINEFGYSVLDAEYSFPKISVSGAAWITLSNACTSVTGCSLPGGATIGWDENDGLSKAYSFSVSGSSSKKPEDTMVPIPSESFTLTGTSGTTTPEPGSIMLFGSGILGLSWVLRRKLTL